MTTGDQRRVITGLADTIVWLSSVVAGLTMR
jgi:hypothetical protein